MNDIQSLFKSFLEPEDMNIENIQFPKPFVEKVLSTDERLALAKGHKDEREENICRLLGCGMSVDDVSIILKI